MRILVVGASGHLGSAVAEHFAASADVTATTRAELDVSDHRAVEAIIQRLRPDAVINCSAYTDVDRAEDEPVQALEVNAFAVRVLANASRASGAAFVHYSTDFVFDGTSDRPYAEEDPPNPRSTYACSKLIGEWFAREAGRHYVLRVESVFGSSAPASSPRRTSVDRIVDSILEGREAPVFVDRTVSPSFHRDVAAATQILLDCRAPSGLYHCVNSGSCTWEELAREIGRQLGITPRLKLLRTAEVKLRANRPRHCAVERQACGGRRGDAELAGRDRPLPGHQATSGRPFLTTSR
jgi:dTDP-4-dehydrorhamnose reductase